MGKLTFPWERCSVTALIKEVERNPCLWNPEDPYFRNKSVKGYCFQSICTRMKKDSPDLQDLTPDLVKSKFTSLRTYYQNKVRKIQSGFHENSKWEYFGLFSFMSEIEKRRQRNMKLTPTTAEAIEETSDASSISTPSPPPLPSTSSFKEEDRKRERETPLKALFTQDQPLIEKELEVQTGEGLNEADVGAISHMYVAKYRKLCCPVTKETFKKAAINFLMDYSDTCKGKSCSRSSVA